MNIVMHNNAIYVRYAEWNWNNFIIRTLYRFVGQYKNKLYGFFCYRGFGCHHKKGRSLLFLQNYLYFFFFFIVQYLHVLHFFVDYFVIAHDIIPESVKPIVLMDFMAGNIVLKNKSWGGHCAMQYPKWSLFYCI